MDYTVKAKGDYELDVLGVPFGDPDNRDADNQYFDKDTQVHSDKFPTVPAVYYHGRDPDGQPMDKPEYFGTAKYSHTDKQGHWYRVILDKTKELAQRVWEAAKQGLARASSGSAPHLVRIDRSGHIKEWAVMELSIFDAVGNRQPANRHAVAVPVLKSLYKEAGIDYIDQQPEAQDSAADNNIKTKKEVNKMDEKVAGVTPEDVEAKIAAALKADREAQADAVKAAKVRQDEIDAEVKRQVDAVKAEAAKGRRLPDSDGVPYASQFNTRRYDNLSAGEHGLLIDVMTAKGLKVPAASVKALALKLISEKPNSDGRAADLRYIKSAMPDSMLNEDALKAAEVMATGDSGNGSDWVGTAYSTELWRSIRHDGGIVSRIPEVTIPDGFSSQYFPLEDVDPTWYKVAETTAVNSSITVPEPSVTASKAGTGTKQISVSKLGARVFYTGELVEDSLINFAPQMREQMMVSGREIMEAIVINGDTETGATTNVNDIGGTPAASDWFMLANGFRKLALVTNTANSRSAGGALSIEDYMETMKLMGTAGLAASDLSKIFFIVDPNVHFANMTLPEVKTRDVFSAATIENGFLTRAYGVSIFPSWQFHKGATGLKANTAGKIDLDTQGNNTTGAILCVRPDQWKLAYKRRMTMEVTRFANSDTWEIVALARFGLGFRDNEASAISYNVGI